MKIIVDTREQKPLFKGKNIIKRKLDEGDYIIEELEDKIIIERKSMEDLYGSLIQGHVRFADELNRARLKGKKIYIVIEGLKEDFITKKFKGGYYCKMAPRVLIKILTTMEEKYGIMFVWCIDRKECRKKIIDIININKQIYNI